MSIQTVDELIREWSTLLQHLHDHRRAHRVLANTELVAMSGNLVTLTFPAGRGWLKPAAQESRDLIEAALTLTVGSRCIVAFAMAVTSPVPPPPARLAQHHQAQAGTAAKRQHPATLTVSREPKRFMDIVAFEISAARRQSPGWWQWLAHEYSGRPEPFQAREVATRIAGARRMTYTWEEVRKWVSTDLPNAPPGTWAAIADFALAAYLVSDLSREQYLDLRAPWDSATERFESAAALPVAQRLIPPAGEAACLHGAPRGRCLVTTCANNAMQIDITQA